MIRAAIAKDFIPLSSLYQQIAASVESPALFNWDADKALAELHQAQTLVFELEQQMISFISYRESDQAFEITALGTGPAWRRHGYLEALLRELTHIAAQHSKPLWLEVHALNQAALRLYQKWGFVLVSSRKDYYPDGASALLMTREPT